MRCRVDRSPVPADLQVYEPERWADEARERSERGGSQRYYAALLRAGVSDDIANVLRADAAVADLREERRLRMAGRAQ